jgi:hypothetical protein
VSSAPPSTADLPGGPQTTLIAGSMVPPKLAPQPATPDFERDAPRSSGAPVSTAQDRSLTERQSRERVLTGALLAAAGLSAAYLCIHILLFRYGRDQGIYATVAATLLRGGMPYRDAWDFKPPGIFVIYALSRALLGPGQWAIRVFEVLGLGGVVYAFVILSRRFFGSAAPGILGGALAVLVHAELEFWHTAQPESFGGMLTIFAIAIATFEPAADDPRRTAKLLRAWSLAGLLYGITFLLKPPLGGGAVATAAFVALRAYPRSPGIPGKAEIPRLLAPFLVMGAASVGVVLLFALWFAARGAWSDLYQVMFVFTPEYTKLGWEDAPIPGMFYLAIEEWFFFFSSGNALGLLAAMIMRPIALREREGIAHILAVVAVQLAGVTMQAKFFPYHFGASLMLGSLVAGLGIFKLWRWALARGWLAILAFAALAAPVLFARTATRDTETDFLDRVAARQRALLGKGESLDELNGKLYSVADVSYDADRRVAAFLREHLAPTELVYIWGFEPMIYDMADRRPASRYIYDVPQRVAWYRDRARAELMGDLAAHPPRAVVVEHHDVFPAVTGESIDSADTLVTFPALSGWLHERYDFATAIEDFDIYFPKSQ